MKQAKIGLFTGLDEIHGTKEIGVENCLGFLLKGEPPVSSQMKDHLRPDPPHDIGNSSGITQIYEVLAHMGKQIDDPPAI